MFEGLHDLDAAGALASAAERRRDADRAEAQLLGLAAHWADLHAVVDPVRAAGVTVAGMERLMPLAGEGTPLVAEFAPAELAAALGISSWAGQELVGDALELRHRLPQLWVRVGEGSLQAWRARQVARRTRWLSRAGAAWVDGQVAPFAHKIGLMRLVEIVEAALVRFDPEAAARRTRAQAEGRGVWLGEETVAGTTSIRIEADALDAASFDQTIGEVAAMLAALGDTDSVDVRRARAVGVVADPQEALDLLGDAGDGPGPVGRSGADQDAAGEAAEAPAGRAVVRSHRSLRRSRGSGRSRRAKMTLYVHLHADAVHTHTHTGAGAGDDGDTVSGGGAAGGVARVEGLGPVVLDQVAQWLGREVAAPEVTLTPVLDLAGRVAVDAYETPERIGETVHLVNPCCPFPWCNNLSRGKDTDHVAPYVPPAEGGPPGQTGTHNLAKPCRRHHRLKTHGGWSCTMPEPGLYLWRSPHHRRYLVDHTGTTALDPAA